MDQHDQEEQEDAQSELERLFRAGKLSHQGMLSEQEQQVRHQQNLRDLQQGKLSRGEVSARIEGLAKAHFTEAIPTIEQFLTSEDSLLREIALKSLTRYFGLEKHWETARHFLLEDPDEDCRQAGAEALSYLQQDTGDTRTMTLLASVVCNTDESQDVRKMAYAAFLAVRHYDGRDWYTILNEKYDLESEAGWEIINSYT